MMMKGACYEGVVHMAVRTDQKHRMGTGIVDSQNDETLRSR